MAEESSQVSATSRRLPALYLACREIAGTDTRPLPLMARLLETAEKVDAVVFITTHGAGRVPQLRSSRPADEFVVELRLFLEGLGHTPTVHQSFDKHLARLTIQLFARPAPDMVEVRLGSGMTAGQYRRLGESLCLWRDRHVMLICVDQLLGKLDPQQYRSPHDSYWRGLLNQWVEERNWEEALSGSALGSTPSFVKTEKALVSDNTLCLLHAAFGIGGSRAPQRLFGFYLDDNERALSGYCWMD